MDSFKMYVRRGGGGGGVRKNQTKTNGEKGGQAYLYVCFVKKII